jgi:hypothetical protein
MVPASGTNKRVGAQLLLFVMLFAVAIPWYWEVAGFEPGGRTAGLPNWFVVAVLASAAISLAAAWQLRRPWPGEEQPPISKERRQP